MLLVRSSDGDIWWRHLRSSFSQTSDLELIVVWNSSDLFYCCQHISRHDLAARDTPYLNFVPCNPMVGKIFLVIGHWFVSREQFRNWLLIFVQFVNIFVFTAGLCQLWTCTRRTTCPCACPRPRVPAPRPRCQCSSVLTTVSRRRLRRRMRGAGILLRKWMRRKMLTASDILSTTAWMSAPIVWQTGQNVFKP